MEANYPDFDLQELLKPTLVDTTSETVIRYALTQAELSYGMQKYFNALQKNTYCFVGTYLHCSVVAELQASKQYLKDSALKPGDIAYLQRSFLFGEGCTDPTNEELKIAYIRLMFYFDLFIVVHELGLEIKNSCTDFNLSGTMQPVKLSFSKQLLLSELYGFWQANDLPAFKEYVKLMSSLSK